MSSKESEDPGDSADQRECSAGGHLPRTTRSWWHWAKRARYFEPDSVARPQRGEVHERDEHLRPDSEVEPLSRAVSLSKSLMRLASRRAVKRIDVHAHFLPGDYRAALAAVNPSLARLPDCSTDALLEMMNRFQIDAAVLSLSPPGVFHGDTAHARELARSMNEHAAELRRGYPKHFAALGVLPLPDVEASVSEIGHCLNHLKLDGFELFSHVAGVYLGDHAWNPVLEELNAHRAYVFVHPVFPPYPPPLRSYPAWLFEFPFESTRAIVNLIYGGAFERFQNIRWHFPHLSGAAVFLAHRIGSLAIRNPEQAGSAPAGALAYLRRLFLDTAQADNNIALGAVLELTPVDRVIFGTDWPYAALPTEGRDPAPGLSYLDRELRAGIDGVNASALVPWLLELIDGDTLED